MNLNRIQLKKELPATNQYEYQIVEHLINIGQLCVGSQQCGPGPLSYSAKSKPRLLNTFWTVAPSSQAADRRHPWIIPARHEPFFDQL